MKRWQSDLALFLLASPILAVRAVVRFLRHLSFLRMTVQSTLTCPLCKGTISLLGMYKCACGHVFQGHLLSNCESCGSSPSLIRCYRCGATKPVRR